MTEASVDGRGAHLAQIAGQVRRARKLRDWTGDELAEQAGVSRGTITRVEGGLPVRPGNLLAVRTALGITDEPVLAVRKVDDDVQLALDLIEKSLSAIEDEERRRARVRELIRFLTLADG